MTRTDPLGAGPTGARAASIDSLGNGVVEPFLDDDFDVEAAAAEREEPPAARLLTNLP